MSTPVREWCLNHALYDAQNVCALVTIVRIVIASNIISQNQLSSAQTHISGSPGLCHLLHKPSEDRRRLVVDHSMSSLDDCTVFYISASQWRLTATAFALTIPQPVFLLASFSAGALQVILQVLRHGFVWDLFDEEEGRHLSTSLNPNQVPAFRSSERIGAASAGFR